jgi:DNA-binding CsgD family transcriptional regulator
MELWDEPGEWPGALTALGVVAWDEGRIVDALGLLRAAVARAPVGGEQRSDSQSTLTALLAAIGERDGEALTSHERSPRVRLEPPAAAAWRVREALAAGDREQAETIVREAEMLATQNFGLPALNAAACHARGILDRDAKALEQAAVDQRNPRALGSVHEDAGVILSEEDRVAARSHFEDALHAYEHAHVSGDADRMRTRLRNFEPPHRERRRDRPRWGWSSLTSTECRVAEAVAEGLTNARVAERMFLSRHTIDFHLRQIYRKLGISSRVELTRVVLEHAS